MVGCIAKSLPIPAERRRVAMMKRNEDLTLIAHYGICQSPAQRQFSEEG